MGGPIGTDKLRAISGMHACLSVIETEALRLDLRSTARFIRLARLEIEDQTGEISEPPLRAGALG